MFPIELTLEEIVEALKPTGLPDIVYYQYYKQLQSRKIIINEQISDSIIETAVLPLLDMDNDKSGDPIEIILSTYGGSVYSGFSLID